VEHLFINDSILNMKLCNDAVLTTEVIQLELDRKLTKYNFDFCVYECET